MVLAGKFTNPVVVAIAMFTVVVATLACCAAAWIGLVVPALRPLYDYAWFVGFCVGLVIDLVLVPNGTSQTVTSKG